VAAEADKALKKNTMELGGSDAFIVLDDADLDKAIEWGVWGRMNNAGQCCVGAKRFILHEKIADEFLSRFKSDLAKFVPGDPTDPKTTLAPLCTDGAMKLVERQIDTAIKGGATVLLGGKRVDRPGYFLEPTILTNIKPENQVYYQEFFSPVAMIFRVKNDEEAVKLANNSPYGLGGSGTLRIELHRSRHRTWHRSHQECCLHWNHQQTTNRSTEDHPVHKAR
jgi:succinate-semialdehyde dehydrogenase/glutarate-semialdehyde dehydrogenase